MSKMQILAPLLAFGAVATQAQAVSSLVATESETAAPTAISQQASTTAPAADAPFKPSFKFGGYFIGKYASSDQEGVASNGGFDIRLFRAYGNGYVLPQVYYRFQFELNDAPGTDRGPRLLDAFVEWQPYEAMRLKLGQFKRPFGFENPMSPLDIGFGNFSQIAVKLQSINDRIGAHRSSGRDIGLQVQGDLLRNASGTPLLHYQVGLFNGQGINHRDLNSHKDLIGGLWVSPVRDLNIGAFGWNGRHTNESDRTQTINLHRYGLGVKYEAAWTVRGEYVHSVGTTLKGGPDRSDGWYVAVGAPIPKVKGLKVYGNWAASRDNAHTWQGLKNDYCLTANYWLNKNFMLQLNYIHTYDRSLAATADRHYNVIDAQVVARF